MCERGIKTFDSELRNTLDLAGVALAKELCHLPVVVDPSHATGRRSLVPAAARAAVAIGADGIIIEVHPCPERALSDGPQSLDLPGFAAMMQGLQPAIAMVAAGQVRPVAQASACGFLWTIDQSELCGNPASCLSMFRRALLQNRIPRKSSMQFLSCEAVLGLNSLAAELSPDHATPSGSVPIGIVLKIFRDGHVDKGQLIRVCVGDIGAGVRRRKYKRRSALLTGQRGDQFARVGVEHSRLIARGIRYPNLRSVGRESPSASAPSRRWEMPPRSNPWPSK